MADDNRYARLIYVNGIPYKIRDEDAQTKYAQISTVINNLNNTVSGLNDIISENFDGKNFIGNLNLGHGNETNYEERVKNSKIPTFETDINNDTGIYTLKIGVR